MFKHRALGLSTERRYFNKGPTAFLYWNNCSQLGTQDRSPMNEPIGEEGTLPTCRRNSPSPVTSEKAHQPKSNQQEISGTTQPEKDAYNPISSFRVANQPVDYPEFVHREGKWRSTPRPYGSDTHGETPRSLMQATVESASPSPRLAPVEPVATQPTMEMEGDATPWVSPLESPVDPRPLTPTDVDFMPWMMPAKSMGNRKRTSMEEEIFPDRRLLPVLQVVTPPNNIQQEQYGGPISTMGRWWWPGRS